LGGAVIKAVVFDYGKVICLPPPEAALDELVRISGLGGEILESLRWKHRDDYDRGAVTGAEYYRRILKEGFSAAGKPGTRLNRGSSASEKALEEKARELARADMAGWTRIDPGTAALMAAVKRARLILGILSNMPGEFLDRARQEMDVFKMYDVGIFSCAYRLIKPEAEIYRALTGALKVFAGGSIAPEEIIFFDDVAVNVNAARAQGILSFEWKDPEDARKLLRQYGVLI
jgi:putative hydrolase of the HAD superfamily